MMEKHGLIEYFISGQMVTNLPRFNLPLTCVSPHAVHKEKRVNNSSLSYLFFLGNSQTSFHNQMPVYPEGTGHNPNIYWSLNTLHEVIFNYIIKPEQGSGHVFFDYECSLCSYYC